MMHQNGQMLESSAVLFSPTSSFTELPDFNQKALATLRVQPHSLLCPCLWKKSLLNSLKLTISGCHELSAGAPTDATTDEICVSEVTSLRPRATSPTRPQRCPSTQRLLSQAFLPLMSVILYQVTRRELWSPTYLRNTHTHTPSHPNQRKGNNIQAGSIAGLNFQKNKEKARRTKIL